MKKLTDLLALFILLTSSASLFAQQSIPEIPVFTKKEAIEDVDALTELLKSYHSGLFWYMDEGQFENKVNNLKSDFSTEVNEWELFKAINPLVANVNCGHTSLRPSSAFYHFSARHFRYFPAKIKFVKGKVLIDRLFATTGALPRGTVITAINDQPVQDIVDVLLPQITSDGYIETAKYRELEYWFALFYARFVGQPENFQLDIVLPNQTAVQQVTLPAIQWKAIDMQEEAVSPISLELLPPASEEKRVAVLTVKSFDEELIKAAGIPYERFLEDAFKTIRSENIGKLILDLRGNYGGNDTFGAKLFAYLATKPFDYYSSIQVNADVKDDLPRNKRKSMNLQATENGFMLGSHESMGQLQPEEMAFTGDVFVLIDGGSFSATAGLAAIIQQKKRGVFVGEETGGAFAGNTSGMMFDAVLPNSGMRIVIPVFRYTMAVDGLAMEKGRGILPDYRVEPTVDEWLADKDVVLDYALKLAARESIALLKE